MVCAVAGRLFSRRGPTDVHRHRTPEGEACCCQGLYRGGAPYGGTAFAGGNHREVSLVGANIESLRVLRSDVKNSYIGILTYIKKILV